MRRAGWPGTLGARVRAFALAACVPALVLALATPASALTLEAYAERVDRLHDASARMLADGSVTVEEAAALSSAVLEEMPASETVEQGTARIDVDNAVAVSLAQRLGAATSRTARTRVAQDLDAHLAGIARSAGEAGAGVPEDRGALDELLNEQQVQQRNPLSEWFAGLVDRLGRFLMNWWEGAGASPGVTTVMRVGTWALLALMAAALLWVLVRAVARLRAGVGRRAPLGAVAGVDAIVAAAEGLPEDALAFADGLAAQERWRDAVRALFGGAARELVRAGYVIEAHRRTNGELLLEVLPAAPHAYEPLAALCGVFERAWYGHHDPGAAGFAESRAFYERVTSALAEQPQDARELEGGEAS